MGDGSAALWGWGGWGIPPACNAGANIRAYGVCASVSCGRGLSGGARFAEECFSSSNLRAEREFSLGRGLNSRVCRDSLRIPFRPVSRPAQEGADEVSQTNEICFQSLDE